MSGCLAEHCLHHENEKYEMSHKSNNQFPKFPIFRPWKYTPFPTNEMYKKSFDIIDKFPFLSKKHPHKRNINRVWSVSTNYFSNKKGSDERITNTILDTYLKSDARRHDVRRKLLLSSFKNLFRKRSDTKPVKEVKSRKEGSKDDFDSNSYFMLRPLKRYSLKYNNRLKRKNNLGKVLARM